MRADTIRQAVEDRCDLDLGLQDTKSPFDVGQRLVAGHDLKRRRVWNVGDEDQFAIHQPGALQRPFVDLVGEQLGGEIHFDDVRQMCVGDRLVETVDRAGVGQFPARTGLAGFLGIELLGPLRGIGLERRDTLIAHATLFAGPIRAVGDDQTKALPLLLTKHLFRRQPAALLMEGREQAVKIPVAPGRDGQNELQRLIADPQRPDGFEIVETQQAAIGNQDHALDRVARQHFLDGRYQRRRLAGIAGKDLVMDRQAVRRLDHPQHHLAHRTALLGMAEVPQVFGLVGAAFGTDRRQVVEDDCQLLIDQRPQQTRQGVLYPVGAVRQSIHRAQQVLVDHRLGAHLGNPGALQPAQDPQLGFRITQPVEDHHPQQALGVELVPVAQQSAKGVGEAQLLPQGGQQPGIANAKRRRKGDLAGSFFQRGLPRRPQEPVEQRVGLARSHRLDAPEGGDDPLARYPGGVPVGLDELDVLPRAGRGDLHEHVATVSPYRPDRNGFLGQTCHYKKFSAAR
ncbi:MAG: hypothetical protein FAZ92_03774 [Accumulibacter sp.]|nr:MAG: hypothetical protein FAZ92_03774 [Accumulibacter sp.]